MQTPKEAIQKIGYILDNRDSIPELHKTTETGNDHNNESSVAKEG